MAEAKTYLGLAAAMRYGRYLSMGTAVTTAPVTKLEHGDFWIHWNGTEPNLAVCWTTGGQGIKYIALYTKTIGYGTYP